MKKVAVMVTAVLLVAGLVGFSAARMKGKGDGPMRAKCGEHMMMEGMASLGLSDAQTADIKAIHARAKKDVIRKSADLKVANLELKELMDKDPVDMKAVETKLKQVEGLRTDLRLTQIKTHEEVRAKLTAEQRKKFSSMHDGMGCMAGGCSMCGCGGDGKGCSMMHDMDDDHGRGHGGHREHKGPAKEDKHKH